MVDLKLSFDPMTIEHLGFKMYSQLPNAIAELVANAYDADASSIMISVDPRSSQQVQVIDDGHGMSPEDLADRYLRIGRNRRTNDSGYSESGLRRVAGRKGLGKLALFGIGNRITVRTKRLSSDFWTVVVMDWEKLKSSTGGEYLPETTTEEGLPNEHGTAIVVDELQRKSPILSEDLARSLSKLFNYADSDFAITVRDVSGRRRDILIDRDLRYSSIEKETRWRIPDEVRDLSIDNFPPPISGVVYATVRPLPQEMRGLTVYIRGRMANEPEFFGVPESSHAYSYLTGYVDADYLDELGADVISTDRRSISWDNPDALRLRTYLAALLRRVAILRRDTRKKAAEERFKTEFGVDADAWTDTIKGPESEPVKQMLDVVTSADTDMSDFDRRRLVENIERVAPEYADMHWRHLHPSIQQVAGDHYRAGRYYTATVEAIKRYIGNVRKAVGDWSSAERRLLEQNFGEQGQLDVFRPWIDHGFTDDTHKNVRLSQKSISVGIQEGFRNPLSHEEVAKIEASQVITYQDCLDALSILSHLNRRLDGIADTTECASSSAGGP